MKKTCSALSLILSMLFCCSGSNSDLVDACKKGDLEMVRRSVDNGADVNLLARNGWPVVYLAAVYRHGKIVKFLLDRGARVEPAVINDAMLERLRTGDANTGEKGTVYGLMKNARSGEKNRR